MARARKIILFIVEGVTDKYALDAPLRNILTANEIDFCIIHGDITGKIGIDSANIKKVIGEAVKNFFKINKLGSRDIAEIVHLIDTDGAFVDAKYILPHENADIHYDEENIFTKNVAQIIERNQRKTQILKHLAKLPHILKIQYSVYYFSRNREHIFHNLSNSLSDDEKMDLADSFSDTFAHDKQGFLQSLQDVALADTTDYTASWESIFEGTQSLKQCSNFYIYFKRLIDENK